MKVDAVTSPHMTPRDQSGAPRSLMHNIRRLNELYQELDQILATVGAAKH